MSLLTVYRICSQGVEVSSSRRVGTKFSAPTARRWPYLVSTLLSIVPSPTRHLQALIWGPWGRKRI